MGKKIANIILLALSAWMGIHFGWKLFDICFFVLFIGIVLYPLPSRFFTLSAIALLVAVPFLIMFDKKDIAQQTAIYAYYFLVFAVMMAIYEIWVQKKEEN